MLTKTPEEIALHILELAEAIAPESRPIYVPVRPIPGGVENECFSNVAAAVKQSGGERRLGWALWEWPGVMVEGEFHAIWKTEAGQLIDVSPRQDCESRILFLPDPSRSYDGRAVNNVRRALLDDPFVSEYLRVADGIFEVLNRGDRAFTNGPITMPKEEILPLLARKALLQHVIEHRPISRNGSCPCGSGRKFKKCCAIPAF